jgi:hypothetical protein
MTRSDFLAVHLKRLTEIEAAARPPPSAAEIAEARRIEAEIAALRTMTASINTSEDDEARTSTT